MNKHQDLIERFIKNKATEVEKQRVQELSKDASFRQELGFQYALHKETERKGRERLKAIMQEEIAKMEPKPIVEEPIKKREEVVQSSAKVVRFRRYAWLAAASIGLGIGFFFLLQQEVSPILTMIKEPGYSIDFESSTMDNQNSNTISSDYNDCHDIFYNGSKTDARNCFENLINEQSNKQFEYWQSRYYIVHTLIWDERNEEAFSQLNSLLKEFPTEYRDKYKNIVIQMETELAVLKSMLDEKIQNSYPLFGWVGICTLSNQTKIS